MNKTFLFSAAFAVSLFFACSNTEAPNETDFSSSSFSRRSSSSNSDNSGTSSSSAGSSGISSSSAGSSGISSSGENGDYSSGNNSSQSGDSSSDDNSSQSGSSSSGGTPQGGSSSSRATSSSGRTDVSSSSNLISSSSSSLPVAVSYAELKESDPNVRRGWNSRYWDACRPHCTLPQDAWKGVPQYSENDKNVPSEAFDMICKVCDKNDNEVEPYFWYDDWGKWFSYNSTCEVNGPIKDYGDVYTCWDMAPVAVNDTLAYAFAATPGTGDQCGKCFQIQFTGEWKDNTHKPNPHKDLAGKTLIVMSSNIGHDVSSGQFDIMIPGGGEGAFSGFFSRQLGIDSKLMGATGGGLLTACDQEGTRFWDSTTEALQNCLKKKCDAAFGNPKHKKLLDGCYWQADWYMAADNPVVLYKEVQCPQYLTDKYRSTINTQKDTEIKWGSW